MLLWCRSLMGEFDAGTVLGAPEDPMVTAALVMQALHEGRMDAASDAAESLCAMGASSADAKRRLLLGLEHFDSTNPQNPWTFCLTSRILIAQGRAEPARAFLNLCDQFDSRGDASGYRQRLKKLLEVSPGP